MVPPSSHGISRAPRYFGSCSLHQASLTWLSHSSVLLPIRFCSLFAILNAVLNPMWVSSHGLASSDFARHYFRNLGWFLFLALLRCFSSGGSPHIPILFSIWCCDITHSGLLHSDICGSILACNSPQLFAAYRVLRRLPMPRHPPCALISLTLLDLWSIFLVLNYASHRLKFFEIVVSLNFIAKVYLKL